MSYSFDLIGAVPVLQFFNHQQCSETSPQRSRAYLSSRLCTLDSFIDAIQLVPQKPNWDWDAVVAAMVGFWIHQEETVRHWQAVMTSASDNVLLVGRVANFDRLRGELEILFQD